MSTVHGKAIEIRHIHIIRTTDLVLIVNIRGTIVITIIAIMILIYTNQYISTHNNILLNQMLIILL